VENTHKWVLGARIGTYGANSRVYTKITTKPLILIPIEPKEIKNIFQGKYTSIKHL